VEIHVVQGERPLASENKSLGRFILDGLPPAARGTPQIEVTFDTDANGILNVSARDKATGRSQHITIQPSSGLSKEEIDRMVREAEVHAEEDRRKREELELRNRAESAVLSAERSLADYGDRVSADVRDTVQSRITAVRSTLDQNNPSALRQALDDLDRALQQIGQAVYGQPGQEAPAGAGAGSGPGAPPPPPPDSETVEGEFREV
jgi:molecular chaperone DnaK